MTFDSDTLTTPIGRLTLIADDTALRAVLFETEKIKIAERRRNPIIEAAKKQLREYFAGRRRRFELPLHFEGTDFQKKVWMSLQTIPFGQTQSYAELAKQVGSPKACRAVGGANRRNPIPIIVPCHRVIGADGTLTGFGGGLDVKARLLDLEREALR